MLIRLWQKSVLRHMNTVRISSNIGICHCPRVSVLPSRNYASYYDSKTEESPDKYTKYEKSFKEWEFVEKLMPPTHVPTPPTDVSGSFPSGWRAPKPTTQYNYFIRRTKNHLIPVYLRIEDRGQMRHTYIGKVEGNIWEFEKDIGRYLQDLRPGYPLLIRTNEMSRHVIVKGDHVENVKKWVLENGF